MTPFVSWRLRHRQSHCSRHRTTSGPLLFWPCTARSVGPHPGSARAVFDIGCGAGRLGQALKSGSRPRSWASSSTRPRRRRHGGVSIRFSSATSRCSTCHCRPGGDAIVCGDILEHLRDPDNLLLKARAWLTPDGTLVSSIPNVRHHSVVRSILERNWTYESAGLLDRTHLRFFTRREIEKLTFRAGFAVEEMRSMIGPGDHDAVANLHGRVRVGRLSIGGLTDQDATEFYTYQYFVRARPALVPDFGTTSIVIVTYNQIEYTRQCLDPKQA